MQLTLEQQQRLQELFALAEENQSALNDWEKKFLADNEDRFVNDEGTNERGYFVTPKMWQIFTKIEDKIK